MATPVGLVRTALRATLGTTEQVVHVMHWKGVDTAGASVDPTQAELDQLVTAVEKAWREQMFALGPKANYTSELVYVTVSGSSFFPDGSTKFVSQLPFGAGTAGSSAAALPYEVALVITTRTPVANRRARGRCFLGGLSQAILQQPGAIVANTRVLEFGNAFKAFLLAVQQTLILPAASGVDGFFPVVFSRTAADVQTINRIEVGNVLDAQTRRRRSQNEIRTSFPVA